MQLLPLNVKYCLSCTSDIASEYIVIKVAPLEDTLDIGDDYVFCTNSYLRIHGKNREQVEGSITIRRLTQHAKEGLAHIGFDDDAIGRVDFYPPRISDESWSNMGPTLNYSIYLKDELFELISDRVKNLNAVDIISVSIGNIDWGWEPDGSRQEWKLDPDSKRNIKPIESFDITFKTQEQTVGDIETREQEIIRKEYDERNLAVQDQSKSVWAEFIEKNKTYIWIAIGIIAIYIFRR